jgi:hypothetical protein
VVDFERLARADEEARALQRLRELKSLGPRAAAAVSALSRIGRDINIRASVQQESLRILGEIGGAGARATLLDAVVGKPHENRAAGDGFAKLRGEDAAAVASSLAEKLERLCPTAQPSSPVEMDRCSIGLEALGKIGADARDALPSLIRLLRIRPWAANLRHILIRSLGEFGPLAKDAVPALAADLEGEPDDSVAAVRTLGSIGPPASGALPQLRRLRERLAGIPSRTAPANLGYRIEAIDRAMAGIQGRS